MNISIKLPAPHPAQQRIIDERARFNVLNCGRRFGKTKLGVDRLVHPALAGRPVAWFSPTYRLLADAWRELTSVLDPVTVRKSESEHRLELRGGGVVEAWSLVDPDAGRGRAYAAVVVDEAALVAKLQQVWQESLRPMLTDWKGEAWFLSTPKGTANYFHTLHQRGREGGSKGWRSWSMPTLMNPFMDPAEIEDARLDLTDLAFAQEYEARFVSWAGAVFRKIDEALQDEAVREALDGTRAAGIGVDWGRTNDYTVFAALSEKGDVVGLDRFRGIEYSLQRERLRAFWERHGCPPVAAEENSIGGPTIEQIRIDTPAMRVKPFLTTNASKGDAVEALALAFERNGVTIPNDPALVGELQAFEGKPLASGLMRYGAPKDGHDDTVIALAIAWALVMGKRSKMFPMVSITKSEQAGMEEGEYGLVAAPGAGGFRMQTSAPRRFGR